MHDEEADVKLRELKIDRTVEVASNRGDPLRNEHYLHILYEDMPIPLLLTTLSMN